MIEQRLTKPVVQTADPILFCNLAWWVAPEPNVASRLAVFEATTLAQMAEVALLDRIETKFVLREARLVEILADLAPHYRVLDIDGTRLNHYRTLYFDTADFGLYRRHHAGGRNRYKVRSRMYVDSNMSFLEVKHKIRKNRTVKNRIETSRFVTRLSPGTMNFLDAHLPDHLTDLESKLWNEYTRVTLVGRQRKERVTLDFNLQFDQEGQTMVLPGIVIAEVKQERLDLASPFTRHMRVRGIRPTGFSKYCLGVSSLYPEIKHNSFKPKLLMLSKLIDGESYV